MLFEFFTTREHHDKGFCSLRFFDGARKTKNLAFPTLIQPTNVLKIDAEGFFNCSQTSYKVILPDKLNCQICTFEWLWKLPESQDTRRMCSDHFSKDLGFQTVAQTARSTDLKTGSLTVGGPQNTVPTKRFNDISEAQRYLDEVEGRHEAEENPYAWILAIGALLFLLLLMANCCYFFFKSRVRNPQRA